MIAFAGPVAQERACAAHRRRGSGWIAPSRRSSPVPFRLSAVRTRRCPSTDRRHPGSLGVTAAFEDPVGGLRLRTEPGACRLAVGAEAVGAWRLAPRKRVADIFKRPEPPNRVRTTAPQAMRRRSWVNTSIVAVTPAMERSQIAPTRTKSSRPPIAANPIAIPEK